MRKLFFREQELRNLGLSEPMIITFRKLTEFVQAQEDLAAAQAEIDTQADDIADLVANDVALDARIDAYDALAPFVRQDQTAAWADPSGTLARTTFAAFAGQTITNPPTQAEVQAIDDHLVIISRRLAALITDLRAISALT